MYPDFLSSLKIPQKALGKAQQSLQLRIVVQRLGEPVRLLHHRKHTHTPPTTAFRLLLAGVMLVIL